MKIIHFVLGKANPNRMNGVNKVVNNLATTQTDLGQNVAVWGITRTPDDVSEIPDRNYETSLFQSINKFFISPKIEVAIKETISKEHLVFHIHGGFIPEFFHLHKLLLKYDIPYIVTPHGCYNEKAMENKYKFKNVYFKLFEKNLLLNAKALHCIGKSEMVSSNNLVPEVNKILIPNGQNISELKFNYRNLAEETLGIPIFGFCGRMDRKMKGLDLLLEGFRIYRKEMNKPGKLWMIGGGQEIEELKEFTVQNGIDKDVKFFGPTFGDEKLNLIANMDAFYHPSRYEGMPTAILEAAALEVPCVVSDATNMAEYIDKHNAGYVLEPNTAKENAWSMVQVLVAKKENRLKEMGTNAKRMVEVEFDWSKIAQEMIEVYVS